MAMCAVAAACKAVYVMGMRSWATASRPIDCRYDGISSRGGERETVLRVRRTSQLARAVCRAQAGSLTDSHPAYVDLL